MRLNFGPNGAFFRTISTENPSLAKRSEFQSSLFKHDKIMTNVKIGVVVWTIFDKFYISIEKPERFVSVAGMVHVKIAQKSPCFNKRWGIEPNGCKRLHRMFFVKHFLSLARYWTVKWTFSGPVPDTDAEISKCVDTPMFVVKDRKMKACKCFM